MGVLTDLVVAEPSEASAVLATANHSPTWIALEAKGIDPIKLATLYFVLRGMDFGDVDAVVNYSSFELLDADGEEGPWVMQVPATFRKEVASIDPSNLASIANKWLQTEELQMDGWTVEETKSFLTELFEFAKEADGRSILLWVSL